jgi:glycosyltransferase involved in cell wall biosynthesis
MKILLCHNFYQQPGGEDQVFHDESSLLESHGHEVIRFTRHNDAIKQMPSWKVALGTIWNRQASAELRQIVRRERPDVVHFTNTFPLISPAAYHAVRREGAKTVQTLHNYRLMCPNAYFLREGKVCEDCLGKLFAWPAIRHACYRDDRKATAVVAGMLAFHKTIGTWTRTIDVFCALTEFARSKFIEGGLPANRIVVKPNFMLTDPGVGTGAGGYAAFAGRLSPEKGIDTLLTAWSKFSIDLPLTIMGDGPLADRVRQAAEENPRICWLGRLPADQVVDVVGAAKVLVFPSLCYEGLPKTIIEAFAKGTPVIGSHLGSVAELIDNGETGLLVKPGDPRALADAINQIIISPQRLAPMRRAAREEFENKYTAEANYQLLLGLYRRALGDASGRSPDSSASVESPHREAIFA